MKLSELIGTLQAIEDDAHEDFDVRINQQAVLVNERITFDVGRIDVAFDETGHGIVQIVRGVQD